MKQWRFTLTTVTLAAFCFVMAVGTLFFASFEQIASGAKGSGSILRGVSALLGEWGARLLAGLFFVAMGLLALWYPASREAKQARKVKRDT